MGDRHGELVRRIEGFVGDSEADSFETLALEAFGFQFENIPSYRSFCDRQGATPDVVTDWRQVPMVPSLAFKRLTLCAGEAREIFRSSGTTSSQPSIHHHSFPELYRATIEASFPNASLPTPSPAGETAVRLPILSLVPSRELCGDSSLSFMVDHVIRCWGDATSAYAIGSRGVDGRVLRAWLAARQRDRRPTLLLGTALALADALEALDRLGLRFRLPAGSVVFETGGYKGGRSEQSPAALARRLETSLGVPPERIVREYGMTELTSQLYSRSLSGGPGDVFVAPHWVRTRILDPQSLEPVQPGVTGMVAIFDLANVGSAVHVLTEDLGVVDAGSPGLRLRGRAEGAELRGCSLTAEELASA